MRYLLFILSFLLTNVIIAQNPITWQFQSVKKGDQQYEVVLKAIIQPGWHLYSQKQPEDAIAIPTEIGRAHV